VLLLLLLLLGHNRWQAGKKAGSSGWEMGLLLLLLGRCHHH
jgi:hypothetical protein